MGRPLPPPLPWEPGGRTPGKPPDLPAAPPLLPWERTSHYPGFRQGHPPEGRGWIAVTSSNVEAIRWDEGDAYPLKVRFLAKDGRPASEYEYAVPFDVYDNMFAASSMGRYVYYVLKSYPYRKVG
jgi:hypothetical protein